MKGKQIVISASLCMLIYGVYGIISMASIHAVSTYWSIISSEMEMSYGISSFELILPLIMMIVWPILNIVIGSLGIASTRSSKWRTPVMVLSIIVLVLQIISIFQSYVYLQVVQWRILITGVLFPILLIVGLIQMRKEDHGAPLHFSTPEEHRAVERKHTFVPKNPAEPVSTENRVMSTLNKRTESWDNDEDAWDRNPSNDDDYFRNLDQREKELERRLNQNN